MKLYCYVSDYDKDIIKWLWHSLLLMSEALLNQDKYLKRESEKNLRHKFHGIAIILRARADFPITVINTALKLVGEASP